LTACPSANLHEYEALSEEELQTYNQLFSQVIQS
jgi:hypothetical protein